MVSVKPFGKNIYGEETQLFIIENGKASAYISDYGAHLVSLNIPDKNDVLTDVVLGFDKASDYEQDNYIGAVIGRNANRIGNGKFKLNGKEYKLEINDKCNHLHGGKIGFDRKMFSAFVETDSVTFSYMSKDMEEGYPGNLKLKVKYTLKDDLTLRIEYKASTDADTIANFTNHSYFNLDGAINETGVDNQFLTVYADEFCKTDENALADGNIIDVTNTPMDFRTPKQLKTVFSSEYYQIKSADGIDHNYILGYTESCFKKAAELYSEKTGISLCCFTDAPGVQIYTGNHFDGKMKCKAFSTAIKHGGICFETQKFPNAINLPNFPSSVLKKNDTFNSVTEFRFSIK